MRLVTSYQGLGKSIKKIHVQGFQGHRPLDEVLVEVIDGSNIKMRELVEEHPIKVQLNTMVKMTKKMGNEEREVIDVPFLSKAIPVANETEINFMMNKAGYKIMKSFEAFIRKSSGWTYVSTVDVHFMIYRHKISSGGTFIKVPADIGARKAIINVNNGDREDCFAVAYASAKRPVKDNADRIAKYKDAMKEFATLFKKFKFPMTFDQIKKFEELSGDSINVFCPSNDKEGSLLIPRYISKNPTGKQIVDMLYWTEKSSGKSHFAWIHSIDKFGRSMTGHHGKKLLCRNCMNFQSVEMHVRHVELCKNNEAQNIVYPAEGEVKKFVNFNKQLEAPGVIYIDFESILKKSAAPEKDQSTVKLNEHLPCGFCIYLVTMDGKKHKPIIRRVNLSDPNIDTPEKLMDEFYRLLDKEAKKVDWLARYITPMDITPEQQSEFEKVQKCGGTCHICKDAIKANETEKGRIPVRDHCHLTGKFRGIAHNTCNRSFRFTKVATGETYDKEVKKSAVSVEEWKKLKAPEGAESITLKKALKRVRVPVIAHNMRGYDGHIILNYFNARFKDRIPNCIPNNMEKYMMFEIGNLLFLDSAQFMNSSLDQLAKNLCKSRTPLEHYNNYFKGTSSELRDHNKMKGVYPYEYMDSYERFDESSLPPQEAFNTALGNKTLSKEEYEHAVASWKINNCKTLGDYHDTYLLIDVLLLADVFETFRKFIHRTYGVEACHYYTLPGIAFDAMLLMTDIKLELLSDPEMYLFFEAGVRGGISMITHRLAKANFPGMSTFDKNVATAFIEYLDANNLYGWAMIQYLATGNFKWLKGEDYTLDQWKELIKNMTPTQAQGITFEVDIRIPKELHDKFSCYPLFPTKEAAPGEDKSIKLLCTLEDKEKYVVHYQYLQEGLKRGYELTKVHRAVEYDQSPWLAQFIEFNTKMRAAATNEFEKDLFKLMNNAIYGKFLENLRKRQSIKLVTSEAKMLKLISSPRFEGAIQTYSEHMVAVGVKKGSVKLNNLPYLGQAILDLSKTLMSEFHYGYIKEKYGDKAKLLFTDTDSLCYRIETPDIDADYRANSERFDMSEYPKDHPLYDEKNKKVPGLMKDESAGIRLTGFAGNRAKCYATTNIEEKDKKRAKGVVKCIVDKQLTFDDYEQIVLAGAYSKATSKASMTVIRSHKHKNYTEKINKIALSSNDTKRYILADGIHTRPHGHWRNL